MTPEEIDKLRQLYTEYERIRPAHPDVRQEVLPNLIRQIPVDADDRGTVIYSQLDETGADAAIQEQMACFEQAGFDFEWKHYDYDTPPDLKERLRSHGFVLEETEAIMALPLADAPAGLLKPVTHDVRRVLDPAGLDDIKRIKDDVWGEERDFIGTYLRQMLLESPQRMSIYTAHAAERPVACGWIHFPDESPFASLWGGSTLAGYRKRGFYTALLAVRTQEAIARGKQYLTIDASPMSRPIVERFGFVLLAESTPCIWHVHRSDRGA